MPTSVHCQFADESKDVVVGVSTCEQPVETWPIQDVVASDDARYVAYYEGIGAFVRQFLVSPGD